MSELLCLNKQAKDMAATKDDDIIPKKVKCYVSHMDMIWLCKIQGETNQFTVQIL